MAFTYQPFAAVDEIVQLGQTLRQNVADTERTLSCLAGGGLLLASLGREGLAKALLVAAGAALVHRGWTGHCAVYEQLDVAKRRAANEREKQARLEHREA